MGISSAEGILDWPTPDRLVAFYPALSPVSGFEWHGSNT
jgi:hypothetical protein